MKLSALQGVLFCLGAVLLDKITENAGKISVNILEI